MGHVVGDFKAGRSTTEARGGAQRKGKNSDNRQVALCRAKFMKNCLMLNVLDPLHTPMSVAEPSNLAKNT
jgi:hypothetical protein